MILMVVQVVVEHKGLTTPYDGGSGGTYGYDGGTNPTTYWGAGGGGAWRRIHGIHLQERVV